MTKVFVTQHDPNRDFSKAERFGQLVFLSNADHEIWADRAGENTNLMYNSIHDVLMVNEFDPKTDFILLSGDPMSIAMTAMFVEDFNPDKVAVSFLKYSNTLKDYFVVEV